MKKLSIIVILILNFCYGQDRRARVISSHHISAYVMQDPNAKEYADSIDAIRVRYGYPVIAYRPAIDTFFLDMKNAIVDPRIALGYNLYTKFSSGNGFGNLFDGGNFGGTGGNDPLNENDLRQAALINCFNPGTKALLSHTAQGSLAGTVLSDSGIIFSGGYYINTNFSFPINSNTGFLALYESRQTNINKQDIGFNGGGNSYFILYGGYVNNTIYGEALGREVAITYTNEQGLKELNADGTNETVTFRSTTTITGTGTYTGTFTNPLPFFVGSANNNGSADNTASGRVIGGAFISKFSMSASEQSCFERCFLAYKERRNLQVLSNLNPY